MGSTEYIIILCFVITIWSNTVNADIDCRRFVFAPSCRGVSAKRSQVKIRNSQGRMSDDFLMESPRIQSEDSDSETQSIQRYQKRFRDLLRSDLMRKTRSKDSNRFYSLLYPLDGSFGTTDSDD